jgi:hypothetical protein
MLTRAHEGSRSGWPRESRVWSAARLHGELLVVRSRPPDPQSPTRISARTRPITGRGDKTSTHEIER